MANKFISSPKPAQCRKLLLFCSKTYLENLEPEAFHTNDESIYRNQTRTMNDSIREKSADSGFQLSKSYV